MTRTLFPALLLSSLSLTSLASAQSAAVGSAETLDPRWAPFVGCWRAVDDPGATGSRVCVAPVPGGVTVATIVGGQRVSDDARLADGVARTIDAGGCRGTETVRWSDNGFRLYRSATIACNGGAPRQLRTASFFVAGPAWVDVETVEHDDTTSVRVTRLVRAANQQLPDGTTPARPAAARGPSADAMAPFGVDDVIDLSQALPADGVQAAISEAPATFRLNAKALVAMADAGVGDRVIDLMVGLTYPARFVVDRSMAAGDVSDVSGISIASMADPFFSPIVGPAALYNCYSSYSWAASSYWNNCAGYNPLMYGMYPGYYNGFWGAYGPGWIVTQPGTGSIAPGQPQVEGRLVNGRGYTQVRPVETASSIGRDGLSSTGDGSGGSSGNSGVSGSGYSGGGGFSGGGDRMAVPRGPGGDR